MKQRLTFFLFISLLPLLGFAEGSKELYITTYNTSLYLCSDFTNKCNGPPGWNGDRSQFAVYGCTEPDRLYFVTNSSAEAVYMGFQGSGAGMGNKIVFRIKDMAGNIVYTQRDLPGSGAGYISNINQARVGPSQVYGAGGYLALSFHPPVAQATYYIEFNRVNSSSGANNPGSFNMDLIDITVTDTVAMVTKPGRLYCRSWQFQEADNCSATTYVYSADSIITSCTFNDMSGGVWIMFCNQNGCGTSGDFTIDRKSVNTQVLLPQYKIFLNTPDPVLFPAATTLGQIIPPAPWGERFCNNGHIIFHVTVDKPGNVEIVLNFGGPYTPRTLSQAVVAGENLFDWDGLDGTLPTGQQVPNNTPVTFTISYINGLTNLPFYDVEGNPNGFVIGLVSPPGTTPLVYWDDSGVGGTMNLTGCLSPPGCHTWSGSGSGFGNLKTINTWWFNVSTSTVPATINEWRGPQTLVFNQVPPQSYCAGTMNLMFSVVADPNTTEYHFSYTGTGATITHTNPTDAFIFVTFAANATSGSLQVYGTNANCPGNGPTTSLPITIKPIPAVNPPFTKSICSATTVNMPLTSTPPGSLFSWTFPPPTCTPNIVTCPPGLNNATLINDNLSLTDLNPGTVTYHVTPTLNLCSGVATDITVTVNPLPNVVATPSSETLCSGGTTGVTLTSLPATTFTWTVSIAPAGSVTGASAGNGNTIAQTLTNITPNPATVTYTITPSVNGCNGPPVDVVVTVNPTPLMSATPSTQTICSAGTTNIALSCPTAGTTYSWTVAVVPPGSVTGALAGSGNTIAQALTNITADPATVTYSITPLANGCPGPAVNVPVTVNPTPVASAAPAAQTLCSGGTTGIALSSATAGTTFSWTVAVVPAGSVAGAMAGTGNNIAQTLTNTTANIATVTYSVTPLANGCPGVPLDIPVTVNPTPVAAASPPAQTICSAGTTAISLSSATPGTAFSWTVAVVPAGSVTGALAGSGSSIAQTLTNTTANPATVTYTVTPTANGCPGNPISIAVTVNPTPVVTSTPATQTLCSGATTGIALSSATPGTTFSWTVAVVPAGSVTGALDGNGGLIAQTLTNTTPNTATVTYTITPSANGCPGVPVTVPVTVYPTPSVAASPPSAMICSSGSINILLSSLTPTTTFSWTVAVVPAGSVTGALAGSGNAIAQTLINTTPGIAVVTYTITPLANGCPGLPVAVPVTVNPTPVANAAPPSQVICSGAITGINLSSPTSGTTFSWTVAIVPAGSISGFFAGAGSTIAQTLINSTPAPGTATYTVTPAANGCPGVPINVPVTVNPLPVVTVTPCFDPVVSTGSQPIPLKGAVPPGGTWSGAGVSLATFFPNLAGPGTHVINYTYTNTWGCVAGGNVSITVVTLVPFACGNNLTDVRDNQVYPTVNLGGRCWFAANLNYGAVIPSTQMQLDNCTNEKYCFGDNPANCSSGGGMYQWDELMKYTSVSGAQGFCPPEWHVPTEAEWNALFAFYISNGFAGSPLKYTGYSGFNAFLNGARFNNVQWDFNNFAVLFWSSGAHAARKAWAHGMNSFNPSVSLYPSHRNNAFFVRCIKD